MSTNKQHFSLWDSHPVATPLDPNVRLSKLDCPSVVDPKVHRTYRSIVGCISYLVNMTRPDLAFSFSQLSKFLQHPGDTHLAAAYRVGLSIKASTFMTPAPASATSCQVGWTATSRLMWTRANP